MGLAMGGVRALIDLIKESGAAEREAAAEAEKAAAKRIEAYSKIRGELERARAVAAGMDAALYDALHKHTEEEAQFAAEVRKSEEALAAKEKRAKELAMNTPDADSMQGKELAQLIVGDIPKAEADLARLKGQLANIREARRLAVQDVTGKAEGKGQTDQKAAAEKEAGEHRRLLKEQATADAEYADEEVKLRTASANKVMDLQAQMDAATSARNRALIQDLIDQERAGVEVRVRLAKEEAKRKADAEADAKFERDYQIEEELRKAREKRAEDERKQLEETSKAYEQWGNRVGSAFASVFTKGASPAKAMAAVLKEVAMSVLEVARKAIVANALQAGSAAASSQAGVPIAGPALAAAAMSAMIGVVMALVSSLPSARGGWDLPDFTGGALAVLHGGEQVLPREIVEANAKRNALIDDLASRPRGGGPVIQIQAVDAPSVERLARDNDSAFSRAARLQARRRKA
jgi:hypothetical protein